MVKDFVKPFATATIEVPLSLYRASPAASVEKILLFSSTVYFWIFPYKNLLKVILLYYSQEFTWHIHELNYVI